MANVSIRRVTGLGTFDFLKDEDIIGLQDSADVRRASRRWLPAGRQQLESPSRIERDLVVFGVQVGVLHGFEDLDAGEDGSLFVA